MTYEVYRSIFTIAAIAGVVMAVISIILFIKLRISAVIGDLTGATARKGIEAIRTGNVQSGNKKFDSSKVNLQRGRLTAKITPSGNLQQPQYNETTVLSQPQNFVFEIIQDITFIHTDEMIV